MNAWTEGEADGNGRLNGETRAPEGAAAGLDSLVLANRPLLLRFFESLGAGIKAEDYLQELWVNMRARRSGPVDRPLSYLYRAAHNLVRDRYRAERQAVARDHDWFRLTEQEAMDDDTPWAERALLAQERLEAVTGALASIGSRAEACLRLHRIDGKSQKEVAIQLGLSLSTVEGDLRRAYAALLAARRS